MTITIIYLRHNEKQFYKGNTMIKHSTTDDNMTMTVIKNDSHKASYATDTYTLRNRKNEYVGTLCITSNGVMV